MGQTIKEVNWAFTAMGERALMSGVAIGLGVLALVAAVHNQNWYFQLLKVRLIEETWGRTAARAFYVVLGLLLLALGAVIAATGR